MIEFISNGVDINVSVVWMFFCKKTQMLRIKLFLSEVLVTLLEEQV